MAPLPGREELDRLGDDRPDQAQVILEVSAMALVFADEGARRDLASHFESWERAVLREDQDRQSSVDPGQETVPLPEQPSELDRRDLGGYREELPPFPVGCGRDIDRIDDPMLRD